MGFAAAFDYGLMRTNIDLTGTFKKITTGPWKPENWGNACDHYTPYIILADEAGFLARAGHLGTTASKLVMGLLL